MPLTGTSFRHVGTYL